MKKITYILTCFVLVALSFTCTDQSTYRNPSVYELENGAFIRFRNIPPTDFVPEVAANVVINEEVYDPIGNVSQYDLSLTATIVSLGTTYTADNIITLTSFPTMLNITSQMIADAIGVDVSDFGAGDFIEFTGVATRTDGVKFYGVPPTYDDSNGTIGIGNTENNLLTAEGYTDAMTFNYVIACPLDATNTIYTGKYMLKHPVPTCCGGEIFLEQEIELEAISVYQRTFDAIYLEQLGIGNAAITFTINFICGEVTAADNINSGLACSNGISFNGSAVPGGYSETDDSVLVVKFQEACQDCGCPPDEETYIELTKI